MDQDYYRWQAIRDLLGMSQMYPYTPPQMLYMDAANQQRQQNQQSQMKNWQNLLSSGSGATGMTPNAVNAYGEPYYGWGAQTGDWGAGASVPFDAAQYAGSGVPSTASDLSALSGGTGEGGAAAGSSYGYIFPVLAAIAGQHLMSGSTDRRVDDDGNLSKASGHRTGDVFSGDFFTEPWMAWGEQQLGIDTPTAGEKTDAAIDRIQDGKGGFSDFMSTVPGTAYQWFDPVGNFAGDFMSDRFGNAGKAITSIILPQTGLKWFGDWLGGIF